ncbi:MAG: glutamine--fructose-6-phosphate transaminase (isomerizing) [Paludibacteraceae bacterium]|nr:glutamine--fructose-6-phosphate transaminase (isomerizing) [Paludibacteraceae bacterium]
MCGIVGYTGVREAYPILIKGLHRLEYRGYDSAGVALMGEQDDALKVYKAAGRVSDLEAAAAPNDCSGTAGIAHTRWATHGVPNGINAHPHVSQSGNLSLVHNGIIENYATLRDQLKSKGFTFKSETDTEVLVQLIEYVEQSRHLSLPEAVRIALSRVIGAYAIIVMDRRHPGVLVAARKSSPMVIGLGEGNCEFFIASDASPIVEYTRRMVYLNDEEMAVCKPGEELNVVTLGNDAVNPDVKHVELDLDMLEKGGYPHFMLKEIFEQPQCLRDAMRGRLLTHHKRVVLSAVSDHREQLVEARRFIFVSCGTSWHASLIGKQLIERFCRIPCQVEYASEFRYANPVILPGDVVVAISQSGETADTLAAIQLAKKAGAIIFGIVNSVGSSIARLSDTGTYIHVGPEIGVASTKAFTGQLVILTLLALAIGYERGSIDKGTYEKLIQELDVIPEKMEKVLSQNERIKEVADRYCGIRNALYLGRGINYPVALEGALKLKEISYIHAEGYPAAEMKHGPIALIDENMPVVFIATHQNEYEKAISNMQEVVARKGRILAIVTEGDTVIRQFADNVIEIPDTEECLVPVLSVIPLQLLAYHVAVGNGLNVDQPRNLAKSVTVE